MDLNPLADIAESARKQRYEKEIENMLDILKNALKEYKPMKLIEVTVMDANGGNHKITLNPQYIVTVEQLDDIHTTIHMNDGTNYLVSESCEVIMNRVNGDSKTYIG